MYKQNRTICQCDYPNLLKTLKPLGSYMHQYTVSLLVQMMAWCLFYTKPFPSTYADLSLIRATWPNLDEPGVKIYWSQIKPAKRVDVFFIFPNPHFDPLIFNHMLLSKLGRLVWAYPVFIPCYSPIYCIRFRTICFRGGDDLFFPDTTNYQREYESGKWSISADTEPSF